MPTDTPTPENHAFNASAAVYNALLVFSCGLNPDGSRKESKPDAVALSRYLAHDFPRAVRCAQEQIADALPPLTEADVVKLCNGDHAVKAEVEKWRDTFSFVDVTELRGAGEDDPDPDQSWELVAGGSSRYEVREVPRFEARVSKHNLWFVHDNETNDEAEENEDAITQAGLNPESASFLKAEIAALVAVLNERDETARYIVWDTSDDEDARDGTALSDDDYDTEDESAAQEQADAANREDYRENANAWPFAHNYAAQIDRMYVEDFAAAGFVVVEHTPSCQLYAGIDGGGYSFLDAHWAPAFLRWKLHGTYAPDHIYITTDNGLRRVVREGAK